MIRYVKNRQSNGDSDFGDSLSLELVFVGLCVAIAIFACLLTAITQDGIPRLQADKLERFQLYMQLTRTKYPEMHGELNNYLRDHPDKVPGSPAVGWTFFDPQIEGQHNIQCIQFGVIESNSITNRYIGASVFGALKMLTLGWIAVNPFSDNEGVMIPFSVNTATNDIAMLRRGEELWNSCAEYQGPHHIIMEDDRSTLGWRP